MQNLVLKVLPEDSGKRLDICITDFCKKNNLGVSREHVQRLLCDGKIILNGSAATKANHKVRSQDQIRISLEEDRENVIAAEDIALQIVYEDDDLAIIDKPAGLVVHPAPGNYSHTLVNALLHRYKKLSDINPARPGIVHRLDKETSGLLVIAKNNAAHLNLSEQFSQHSIKRKYIALVQGKMEFNENIIEVPIVRHPFKRKNMSVGFSEKAKYAKTYYRTLKRSKEFSFLELEPFTGRTHQLRVHLAFLGHPILGDTKYGKNTEFKRLALHAKYLGFVHPVTGRFIEFSSETPKEFIDFLKNA